MFVLLLANWLCVVFSLRRANKDFIQDWDSSLDFGLEWTRCVDVILCPFDGFTTGFEEKGTEGWKTAMRRGLVCLIRSVH